MTIQRDSSHFNSTTRFITRNFNTEQLTIFQFSFKRTKEQKRDSTAPLKKN